MERVCFSNEEWTLLESVGLDEDGGALYRRMQWPILEQTMPTAICDDPESMETLSWGDKGIRRLRKGIFHSRGRRPERLVFMEESPPLSGPASYEGFAWNTHRPRQGFREIVTSRVAARFAPGLVPHCEVAVIGPWLGVARPYVDGLPPRLVVHQEVDPRDAPSALSEALSQRGIRAGFEALKAVLTGMGIPGVIGLLQASRPDRLIFRREGRVQLPFSDPAVRASLFRLQILDAFCGQVDRHGGNYLITLPDHRISAIDNQKSFWNEILSPSQCLPSQAPADDVFHGVELPPLLDEGTAEAVLERFGRYPDFEDVRPFLDAEEMTALLSRWSVVYEHVAMIERQRRVLPLAECAEAEDRARRSGCELTRRNCYFVRETELLHRAPWVASPEEAAGFLRQRNPLPVFPGHSPPPSV